MKIATAIFTYNRPWHTEQVLNSLKQNTMLPKKLFVFQDGLKSNDDNIEWQQVNALIKSIDWCEKEIIASSHNKGLAESIIVGINYMMEEYDAVIILEDDCIVACDFINFMTQCLLKYEMEPQVYSVSGYSWPIKVQQLEDIYFCGRMSSWGWGTWKNRWETYARDYTLVKQLKFSLAESREMATWGNDLEAMLVGNVTGQVDSWAVFWALNVIRNGGVCVNPYKSLVQNIGNDGSGVHCGVTDRFAVEMSNLRAREYIFPKEITIRQDVRAAFAELYGNYTAISKYSQDKERILLYGLGNLFIQNEKYINQQYYIEKFIDNNKKGCYAGRHIISAKDIEQESQYEKILVMVQDIGECMKIGKHLVCGCGIAPEKIIFGCVTYGAYKNFLKNVRILNNGSWEIITDEGYSLNIVNADQFYNVYEVMAEKTYRYHIANGKKDVVIDVGMNIADATLFFLNNANVEKVYGYEPFGQTFGLAKKNLEQYEKAIGRYEISPIGIGNVNEKRTITFNIDMSCGQSSIVRMQDKAAEFYDSIGLINRENDCIEEIEIRKASEVFGKIIESHPTCNHVLKMDCEGEEYGIIEQLVESGLLSCFQIIMLEWHYEGSDRLTKQLDLAGFSYWCFEKGDGLGLIYASKL